MADKSVTTSGVGLTGLLFIAFLVLKPTHVINWSWWWITAPLWGPLGILLVVIFVVGIVAYIARR